MRSPVTLATILLFLVPVAPAMACDRTCLERIATDYRAAYVNRNPARAPFAPKVRFTENNVELNLPDGSWDTVSSEVGTALTLVDPQTSSIGMFMTLRMLDTPAYLAIRLHVKGEHIDEVEHILSTRRLVSTPPEPFGNIDTFVRNPRMPKVVPPEQRSTREQIIAQAKGYFDTLQNNTGEIRGARFSPDATRHENGLAFKDIEKDFRRGYYRSNDRVRDRDYLLVDEERGIVLARGFIDHKGTLDEFTTTDGEKVRGVFREPHTWSLLEAFKVENGIITAVEANFIGAPYYTRSPWTRHPDR
jgi:hypothetical protein